MLYFLPVLYVVFGANLFAYEYEVHNFECATEKADPQQQFKLTIDKATRDPKLMVLYSDIGVWLASSVARDANAQNHYTMEVYRPAGPTCGSIKDSEMTQISFILPHAKGYATQVGGYYAPISGDHNPDFLNENHRKIPKRQRTRGLVSL